MIRAWHNTDAETAAGMVDVSDEQILVWSNGRVERRQNLADGGMEEEEDEEEDEDEDEDEDDPLLDPDIFGIRVDEAFSDGSFSGEIAEGNLRMGHIALPVPVVNPQYVRGARPVLAAETGLSQDNVEKVSMCMAYLDTGTGAIIPSKGKVAYRKAHPGASLKTGGEAIAALLKERDSKVLPAAVLTVLPVIPACMRYLKDEETGIYRPFTVNILYERVLNRGSRTEKLLALGAPEAICANEIRMLQEAVCDLVDNGSLKPPCCSGLGVPYDSLAEAYDLAVSLLRKKPAAVPEGIPDGGEAYQTLCRKVAAKQEALRKELEGEECGTMEEDPLKKEREEFLDLVAPFLEEIAEDYFPEYAKGFYDELMECGKRSASRAFLAACRNGKPLGKTVFPGAYKQMACFIKKRAAYV